MGTKNLSQIKSILNGESIGIEGKMKKIAIFTLCGYKNYGNRLQNYALQEVIKKLGYSPETIWLFYENKNNFIYKIKIYIKNFIRILIKKKNYLKLEKIKRKNFEIFNLLININYNFKEVINNKLKYDYYIVGSDQVWNYTFKDVNDLFFLKFADKDKTISYAASFGITEIPEEKLDFYKDGLSHINSISVREQEAKKLIYSLIKKESTVVLDPTLLLSKKEWLKIVKEPNIKPMRKYILKCFLGKTTLELEKNIEKIANDKNCDIISMYDKNQEDIYISGPSEFLYYIKNSELILTDSYHAMIFSIIFEKNFFIFERNKNEENMISRVDYLLNLLNLKDRKVEYINNHFDIDYKNINEIIEQEKEKSVQFLKNNLK